MRRLTVVQVLPALENGENVIGSARSSTDGGLQPCGLAVVPSN